MELIKENVCKKKLYYIYKFYERVMWIFEKDKVDYIINYLEVFEEEVLKNVRIEVVEGYFLCEKEFRNLINVGYCIIF